MSRTRARSAGAVFRERVLAAPSPAELLRHNAAVRPDAPAVVGDGRTVTPCSSPPRRPALSSYR